MSAGPSDDGPTSACPAAADVAVAGAWAAIGAVMAYSAAGAQGVPTPAVPAALATLEAVPLLWRRRAPLLVLGASTLVFVAGTALTGVAATPMLGALVAAYTVGTRCRRGPAAVAAAVAGLGTPVAVQGLVDAGFPLTLSVTATPQHLLDALLGSVLGFGGVTLLGDYVGTRRAYVAELSARARRLEREREERAERAVAEERARIARELHDVAAHHLSGIALQASALDRTLERDPTEARGLVAEIRSESSTALTAMRRLVTLLRADDADGRSPQPTLEDLEQLVDRARSEGADVHFEVDPASRSLPPEVGLAAYRVVQESLTNARRHAPGGRTAVRVHRAGSDLHVEVADEGADQPVSSGTGENGHGLVGMRERVTLLGGRFDAGPRDDGRGWRVHAVLPARPEGRS